MKPIRHTCFALFFSLTFLTFSFAQDLSGLSFCIDPGHGGNNSNQGPTGLYEKDINFDVSLYLMNFLADANADTVILTHYSVAEDPSLSEREDIANAAGVSWFHSVHHNAYNGGSRFTLVLMEEERNWNQQCANGQWGVGTGQPEWPGQTDVMSGLMANDMLIALRTAYTITRLDWTFYGGCNGGFSLGVLNNLQMPGQLSEATFFDHPQEERKLRNQRFLKAEAFSLYQSFLDYYGSPVHPTGIVGGIISSANDGQPLNGARIQLLPENTLYTTDQWSNGIYYIFNLAPGQHTLSISRAGYDTLYQSITIQPNQFTFFDAEMPPNTPPLIVSTSPGDSAQNVDILSPIRITFSKRMNIASTESALTLQPDPGGNFNWSEDQRVLTIHPTAPLFFDTTYTVSIAGTARDQWNHYLDGNADGIEGDAYQFQFRTIESDTLFPRILIAYPADGDQDISPQTIISAEFNKPLDRATAVSANTFIANNQSQILNTAVGYFEHDGRSVMTIVPESPLLPAALHYVIFGKDIADRQGHTLGANYQWQFNANSSSRDYQVLDDFTTLDGWTDTHPQFGEISTLNTFAIHDSMCTEINYQFQDSGDVLINTYTPLPQSDANLSSGDELTLAVFGDRSYHHFQISVSNDAESFFTTPRLIDWLGWRTFSLVAGTDSLLDMSGNKSLPNSFYFSGLVINSSASDSGFICVDYLTRGQLINAIGRGNDRLPQHFEVTAAYPNPFNPVVHLNYYLPKKEAVEISIFDVNGKLISSLESHQQFSSGWHSFAWDGSHFASGVYLLRIVAGHESNLQKIILLK